MTSESDIPKPYTPAKKSPTKKRGSPTKIQLSETFMHNTIINDIYQYSILSTPHDSEIPALGPREVSACGTHGIGVLAGRSGELIYLDNKPYQVKVDEGGYVTVNQALKIDNVPLTFFMGVQFEPEVGAERKKMDMQILEEIFKDHKHEFFSFQITGAFDNVKLRVIGAPTQPAPYSFALMDMAERANQGHIDTEKTKGTIFGFCAPEWAKDLCFTGVMCWFVGSAKYKTKSAERQKQPCVGNVADFKSGDVKVEWAAARKWHLQTNDGKKFGSVRAEIEAEAGQEDVVVISSDEESSSDEDWYSGDDDVKMIGAEGEDTVREMEIMEKEVMEKEVMEKEVMEKEVMEKEVMEKEVMEKEVMEKEVTDDEEKCFL
jgi:alpha-acetolactate decarboxylase